MTLSGCLAMCLTLALTGAGVAQDLPAAFAVQGVSSDDRLNIRAEPSSKAQIIGTIGPDSRHLEVISLSNDAQWGEIGLPEGNGWVAMRFLQRMSSGSMSATVPRPFTCLGTEPFWSLSLLQQDAEFNAPEQGQQRFSVEEEATSNDGYLLRLRDGETLLRTAIIRRQACSDGMSDRTFGFSVFMFSQDPGGNSTTVGCCTLDHSQR